jgi:hypothetical protein
MKILTSFTLIMEAMTMGFALLIAKDNSSSLEMYLGGALTLALILAVGLLRRSFGLQIGWCLQICLIAYGLVVSAMYFLGILFAALWWCAIYFGQKGDAIKALRKSSVKPIDSPK